MHYGELLLSALGGLVRVSFDYTESPPDAARLRTFHAAWQDAVPGSGSVSGRAAPLAEVLWPFPDDDGLAASAAALANRVTLAAIEARRGRLLMLHAAGIADDTGRVLAFIGPSGRGKTTVARTLGRRYGYVTDETVGVEPDGTVHPYRKPLSIVRPGEGWKEQAAPSELGLAGLPAAPLRLGGFVLLDRREAVGTPTVTSLPLCEALAAVVPEASYLAELERPLQAFASRVESIGAVRRVSYGDAEQLLPLVPGLFDPVPAEPWAAVLPGPGVAGARHPAGHLFVPAQVVDAVESAGQTAILDRERMVHVLDGVAPVVWKALCAGSGFAALANAVEQRFGPPPDQPLDEALAGVMTVLADAGLLVRVPARDA